MKHLYSLLLIVCLSLPSCSQAKKNEVIKKVEDSPITTYYLIRHAEKVRNNKNNQNPHLTREGKLRAKKWANTVLKDVKFDAVYSTDFHRTKNTAEPTARKHKLDLVMYDPMSMDMEAFKNETSGKTVLIVGHSNTTPMMVNKLIGENKYDEINDSEFGTLFKVTIKDGVATEEMSVIN